MITRESLTNHDPLQLFGELKGETYLTDEQLSASLDKTLEQRPVGHPVWIFAYGSLIWNPVIRFAEYRKGFLRNWSRTFCMKLTVGRGTNERPGRMLGLVPGDGVHGMLLRIEERDLLPELQLLWKREMPNGAYFPLWEEVELENGLVVQALTFVMSPNHLSFDPCHDPSHVAGFIAHAEGPLGTNREYLDILHKTVNVEKVNDEYIAQVTEAVCALRGTFS